MRLDTITSIENFMADALLSSPQIPLGVNVIRLAATTDEEGITNLARSIVVRYTGSSMNIKQRQPLVVERTLRFELIHSSQSYLTESGHEAALQMCAGAYLSLNDTVPMRSGVQVVVPFSMSLESFDGLTDSSHYVYVQQWEITVLELNPTINMNPCVLYGNCSELFPYEMMGGVLPGDVAYGNKLYSPLIPPPAGVDYEEEYCGVVEQDGNLVFKYNTGITFLTSWEQYDLVSTDTFVKGTDILICSIKDKEGNHLDTYYASNCDKRQLLSLDAKIGGDPLNKRIMGYNGMCIMGVFPKGQVYADPTEGEDSPTTTLKYGWVMRIDLKSHLLVEGVKWHKVAGHVFGTAWIKEDDMKVILPNRYEPLDVCVDEGAINEGPQQCE